VGTIVLRLVWLLVVVVVVVVVVVIVNKITIKDKRIYCFHQE